MEGKSNLSFGTTRHHSQDYMVLQWLQTKIQCYEVDGVRNASARLLLWTLHKAYDTQPL